MREYFLLNTLSTEYDDKDSIENTSKTQYREKYTLRMYNKLDLKYLKISPKFQAHREPGKLVQDPRRSFVPICRSLNPTHLLWPPPFVFQWETTNLYLGNCLESPQVFWLEPITHLPANVKCVQTTKPSAVRALRSG